MFRSYFSGLEGSHSCIVDYGADDSNVEEFSRDLCYFFREYRDFKYPLTVSIIIKTIQIINLSSIPNFLSVSVLLVIQEFLDGSFPAFVFSTFVFPCI